MIKEDFELTANIRPNPIIKIAARANGAVDEAAANVSFWNSTTDSIPTQKLQVEDSMYWARFINIGFLKLSNFFLPGFLQVFDPN